MNKCTHSKNVQELITWENDWTGEECSQWVTNTDSTTVDVDIHRYKCTQCNEIMYYSGRARDYYEKGITCHVDGLNK